MGMTSHDCLEKEKTCCHGNGLCKKSAIAAEVSLRIVKPCLRRVNITSPYEQRWSRARQGENLGSA